MIFANSLELHLIRQIIRPIRVETVGHSHVPEKLILMTKKHAKLPSNCKELNVLNIKYEGPKRCDRIE